MKKLGLTVFLSLLAVLPAAGRAEESGRFATPADVIGFWRMLPLTKPEKVNKTNPWPLPYQWFGFYADGAFASMSSTEQADYSEAELREVLDTVKSSAPRWKFEKNKMFTVRYPSSPSSDELWGVNVVTSDIEMSISAPLKPGDLIMTLAGGANGGPVYYRLLRRVQVR